jgi:hypothetical protein
MRYERWGQAAGARTFRWWAVGMAALLLVTVAVVISLGRSTRIASDAGLKEGVSIVERQSEDLTPATAPPPLADLDAVATPDVGLDVPARWTGHVVVDRLDLDALREPDGPGSGGHLGLTGSLHPTVLLVAGTYPGSASVWRIADARHADVVAGVRRATGEDGGWLVAQAPLATAAGPARRLEFRFPDERGGRVTRVVYVVPAGRGALLLRVTTDDIAAAGPVADRMAASLRLIPR